MGASKSRQSASSSEGARARLLPGACLLILILSLTAVLWLVLRDTSDATEESRPHLGTSSKDGPTLATRGEGVHPPPGVPVASLPEAREGHVVVVGRIVGADFAQRADVVVCMRCSDRPEQRTRSNGNGRFALEFGTAPTSQIHVTLVAVGPSGGVSDSSVRINPLGPGVIDVGTLVLRAGLDLAVLVVRDSQPVSGARVFATSLHIPHATRTQAWLGRPWSGWGYTAVSDESGRAVLMDVAAGAVRVLAVAEGPLRGEVQIRTDQFESPVVVELRGARDLRVEVVRASDGSPIPGCHVGAVGSRRLLEEPWIRPVTNEDGVAILRNAPREKIELLIAGPDWSSAYLKMPRHVPPGVTTFRIEVPAPVRVVVPIEVADGPLPKDGTLVRLEQASWAWWPGTRMYLAREGVIREGSLVIERYSQHGWVRALARLPDGRTGHLFSRMPDGPGETRKVTSPVVFQASRTVDVRVVERGTGNPAAGVAVTLSIPKRGSHHIGPVRTDADGHARIEGAPAAKGVVNLCSNPDWVQPSRQRVFAPGAPVDLTEHDALLELQVEPMIDAVVHVRSDGKPRFPPGMDVLLFYWPQGVEGVRPSGLRMVPDRGELWFRVRRPVTNPRPPLRLNRNPHRIHLLITSAAHATERITLEYDQETNRLTGNVDLVAGGALITRVQTPREGRFAFQLERHDDAKGWTKVGAPPLVRFASEPDQERYEGLRPGRYRLTETYGKTSSREVQVRSGADPAVLIWVLDATEYAEGTVVLPPGVDPKGLRVHAWTDTVPPRSAGDATMNGTDFKLRIPTEGRLKVYPVHPRCRRADEEGAVIVSGPEKGLRLRMVLR